MKRKWILIADGSRAKIIEKCKNELSNIGLTHHLSEISTEKDKGRHKPGAAKASALHSKNSFPTHEDWGIFEKNEFAAKMAEIINKNNEAFEELVLIAPPKTLGELRKQLNTISRLKLVEEIDKDYTHTPIKEIESIL